MSEDVQNFTVNKFKERVKEPLQIKDVRISSEPRIKIVAEKFSRCKRHDVEIRKLEGRVVCVEYDVLPAGAPVQVLRAYFSVAQAHANSDDPLKPVPNLPMNDDLKNKTMGIEIIDATIAQNKVYLEDLKRFLKRKQNTREKEQGPLNPLLLYKMAATDVYDDVSYTGLLSKVELEEIKDFIMKKTASSIYGINRRKLTPDKYSTSDTGEDIMIEQILKFM